MIILVSYDLRKPGKDYGGLYEQLKITGAWWHHLDSTWLVQTTETPNQLYNRLRVHLDGNDFILLCEITRNYTGWLPKQAWDWLQQAFSNEPA